MARINYRTGPRRRIYSYHDPDFNAPVDENTFDQNYWIGMDLDFLGLCEPWGAFDEKMPVSVKNFELLFLS